MLLMIQGIPVDFRAKRGDYLEQCAAEYTAPPGTAPDFSVEASDDEIAALRRRLRKGDETSDAQLEGMILYHHFCDRLPAYDAVLFHAAVLLCDGMTIAFTAKSGTGKSTHVAYWKSLYGDHVRILNGDKPLLLLRGGVVYAADAPFRGKEGWGIPGGRERLDVVCFLSRGQQNAVSPLSAQDAIPLLYPMLHPPRTPKDAAHVANLLDVLTRQARFFRLSCTKDASAARRCHDTLLGR